MLILFNTLLFNNIIQYYIEIKLFCYVRWMGFFITSVVAVLWLLIWKAHGLTSSINRYLKCVDVSFVMIKRDLFLNLDSAR